MTREQRTIALLRKGWHTSLECALKGGVWSLSQRVSEWRRWYCIDTECPGSPRVYEVHDRWQKTEGGARVKAYRLVRT